MDGTSKADVYLEASRLGRRNAVLVEFDEKAQFPRLRRLRRSYTAVDLAHAVMLVEAGIVSGEIGASLVGGLLRLHLAEDDAFPWLEHSNSYLVHVEHWLSSRVGEAAAGALQTGRSRNDQDAAAERLFQRDLLLRLAGDLLTLVGMVVDMAEDHAETLMPGYTHLQHAQPWTFGHYLLRQASILSRDVERVRGAYPRIDLSALGGAANAGTSWPIDRRRTAELLGHAGIVVNSCDAGEFARDHIEEMTACVAILVSDLGRFATDLYVWSSFEFGFVEIADGLAGTSSIMPQKKNPHALERVKAVAGQAAGWLATVMACQRPVFSTDLDFAFADDVFGRYAELSVGCLRLMGESVRTLTVHKDRMATSAGAHWSTTSHLADELVRRYGMTFRTAHQVVGRFVRDAIAAGQTPADVRAGLLRSAARELTAVDVSMTDHDLRALLDARTFIDTRVSEGSVAPREVRAHASTLRERTRLDALHFAELGRTVERAASELTRTARGLAGRHGPMVAA